DTDPGCKVLVLRLRLIELEYAGHTGIPVQRLQPLGIWDAGKLPAKPQVESQMAGRFPTIGGVKIRGNLVAVINRIAEAPLRYRIRNIVEQEVGNKGVFIIAPAPLNKTLRRNILSSIEPELECVRTVDPTQIVGQLIRILNRELRGIWIRTEICYV